MKGKGEGGSSDPRDHLWHNSEGITGDGRGESSISGFLFQVEGLGLWNLHAYAIA